MISDTENTVEDEAQNSLYALLISIRNSIQHALKEEAHILFDICLIYIRNAIRAKLWRMRPNLH
jgi:hypothetical protein